MTLIAQPEIINHTVIKAYLQDVASDHLDLHIHQLDMLVEWIVTDGDEQLLGMYLLDDLEYDIHLIPTANNCVDAYIDIDDDMYWIGSINTDGEITHLQHVWRVEEVDTVDAHHHHQRETDIVPHVSFDHAPTYQTTMQKLLHVVRAYLLA